MRILIAFLDLLRLMKVFMCHLQIVFCLEHQSANSNLHMLTALEKH